MSISPLLLVELALLGLATGLLAGLLGIGGGMLLVPFLTYFINQQGVAPGLAVKMAIATSMATIMFTSLSSVRAHHRRGAVRWDIVRRLAPGIVLGGLAASLGVFALLKGSVLAIVFAVFVSFSALQMLRGKKPAASRQMPGTAGQLAAGGSIGFLSGLVGAVFEAAVASRLSSKLTRHAPSWRICRGKQPEHAANSISMTAPIWWKSTNN